MGRLVIAIVLFACAGMAQTHLRELPDTLKNPAQLGQWRQPKNLVAAGTLRVLPKAPDAAGAGACSIPLTEVSVAAGARIKVIRPEPSSHMPVMPAPAPPCEDQQR